nr:hypothetical protein GCM10020185_49960 [Pseudomonas brassicacearum subsp. brassicacearum]
MKKTAQSLLEGIAPGYPAAWVSLAQLLYDFPELGDVDKMMQYLENGRAADQPRAELLLGKLYYEGKWVPADAKVAEAHFQKAVGREVAADYYLGQIYRRGYLGQVYSQKKPWTTCSRPPATARTAPTLPLPSCSPRARAPSPTRSTPMCSASWPRCRTPRKPPSLPKPSKHNYRRNNLHKPNACYNKSRPFAAL